MANKFMRPSAAVLLFDRVESIPGFFNYDDAQHFAFVLSMQKALAVKGDLMEIGTWKGRSAAFLAFYVAGDEKLVLNDVFAAPATDKYSEYPSVQQVRASIVRLRPDVADQLVFLEGDSRTTVVPDGLRLRFVHVDGGHSLEECYSDLCRVGTLMVPGGVIAIDDYDHPDWPEVKPAADRWLGENPAFSIVGDMNRAFAKGRKLYLMHRVD